MRKLSGKKLLTVSLLAVTLVFGLVGCGTDDTSSDDAGVTKENVVDENTKKNDSSEELKTLRMGTNELNDEPIMDLATVAYDKELLEEELNKIGYTLDLRTFAGAGPEINEALASGNLDVAVYGDFPGYLCESNGIDTTLVAMANSYMQYGIIATDKNIKEPKDLEGKKVIVGQGQVTQFFWEQYVNAKDIDASKVEIINSNDFQSLLSSGEADAFVNVLYLVKYLESLGLGTVFDDGSDVPDGYTTYVAIVRNEILEKNPEIGVAINKALIRAYEIVKENPQEYYDSLATSAMSAEIMATGYAFNPSLSHLDPKIGDEQLAYFDKLNNWMYDNGIISEKIDLSKFVDVSFYETAKQELEK